MWRYEYGVTVKAAKQVVWQWWVDAEKWPQWDTDLSEAALLGEAVVGTQGRMKVADDALVPFVISEVIPEERFAFVIALFGATLTYTFTLSEDENGLHLVHGAEIRGIFGFFWRFMLRNKIKKVLNPALDAFALIVAEESLKIAPTEAASTDASAAEMPSADAPVASEAAVAPTEAPAASEASVAEPEQPESSEPVGDPAENELRGKDIRTQIEAAAQVEVPELPKAPEAEEAPHATDAVAFQSLPAPTEEVPAEATDKKE